MKKILRLQWEDDREGDSDPPPVTTQWKPAALKYYSSYYYNPSVSVYKPCVYGYSSTTTY